MAAVATALAHAEAVRDRLAERRAEAAGKRAAQADGGGGASRSRGCSAGCCGPTEFPRWLVASALDTLVADASAGLAELSGGQFELTHDEGEFLVVDHADADARRPVKTLSGGETFQASLALALALSAQMSTLAAEGAARLDSIFLDEGFGTLDEANLDVVAEHAGEPGRPRRPDGRRHHPRPGAGRAGAGAVRGASRPAVGADRARGQLSRRHPRGITGDRCARCERSSFLSNCVGRF